MYYSRQHDSRRSYSHRSPRPFLDRPSPWVVIVIGLGLTLICLIAIWFGSLRIVPLAVSFGDTSRGLAEQLTVQFGEWLGPWPLIGQF